MWPVNKIEYLAKKLSKGVEMGVPHDYTDGDNNREKTNEKIYHLRRNGIISIEFARM